MRTRRSLVFELHTPFWHFPFFPLFPLFVPDSVVCIISGPFWFATQKQGVVGVSSSFERVLFRFSKNLPEMEMNSTVQAERGVFKRAQRSNDLGNENLVKKPALVNPLQEVNNAPSAGTARVVPELTSGISKAPTESVKPSNPLVREPSMQEIVDEHDRDDQLMFSPYAQRIVNNWLKVEEKFHVSPNYLDGQTDIKPYMRETLIDWIMEVNQHFHHRRETLYLCTNIVDRYVAAVIRDKSEVISRSNYQLVGVTAYLIASKYEEIYYPEIRVILDFADGIYTEDEVKRMEVKIVNTLKYDLTVPTTNKFLGRFLRVASWWERDR